MKKMLNVFLIIAILISQFSPFVGGIIEVFAQDEISKPTTVATRYFYNQIKDNNNKRVFYEAMETMLEKGFFKEGNVSMEVTGLDSEDEQTLLKDMGAARDAFLLDYPELFYVDFDYLSLRGEFDERANLHIYLGTGRGDNYINQEFLSNGSVDKSKIDNAISTVNSKINSIVSAAQGQSVREQVKIAHDEVIKAARYTLEYNTTHPYSVRTIYGVFGFNGANDGNAVCEGYARALKTVLDRLGIPTILVRGVYNNISGNSLEEHMWVYVQIGDDWYGVDPTFDNTDDGKETSNNVSDKYLLVSADGMNYHYPLGIISTSNFEFHYPSLNGGSSENKYIRQEDDNVVYSDATGLVVIDAGSEVLGNGKPERVFHISYNGKGYSKAAAEDGIYIITNSWQVKTNHETGAEDTIPSDWNYPSDVGAYQNIYQDTDTYLAMRVDNITALQVGLTNVPQGPKTEENYYGVYYVGGENGIVAMSTDIQTGVGLIDYAQPFPKKTTPSQTLAYTVGKTYHFTIEYDQKLKYEDPENPNIDIALKLYDNIYGYRDPDAEYLQFDISKPELVDDYTIAFNLTPSRLWTMDKVQYMIQFTGVVGTTSEKEPFPIVYGFTNNTTGCIYALRAMGVDMESYGKPTLMDDFELDDILSNKFKEENGISNEILQQYGDLLKHRLSLVVTNTTEYQEKKMEDALLAELGDRSLNTTPGKTNVEMYNISLGLCREQLKKLKDGTKIKIMLGFPLGYGPDDEGVTFKAYHYNDNGDGTYRIEEIDCTVTALGLIIYVDSFSPFTIAAVNATEAEKANTDKTLVFNIGEGGSFDGDTIVSLGEGKSTTVNFKADKGYIIDKILIGDNAIDLKDKNLTSYSLKISTNPSDKDAVIIRESTNINIVYISKNTGSYGDPETGAIQEKPSVSDPSDDVNPPKEEDPENPKEEDPKEEPKEENKDKTVVITIDGVDGGTVSPNGTFILKEGESTSIEINAYDGYFIEDVIVQGKSRSNLQANAETYSFDLRYDDYLDESISVTVRFATKKSSAEDPSDDVNPDKTVVIQVEESAGGTVSSEGTITIKDGEEQTIKIQAKEGYVIDKILVGGILVSDLSKNAENYSLTLKYSELGEGKTTVTIRFKVKEKETDSSSNETTNNPNTSVMDIRAYILLAILSLAGILFLKRKKSN